MNCDDVRQAWHRMHDDGISPAGMEAHLQACDACRRYHARMNSLATALGMLQRASEHLPAATPRRSPISPKFTPFVAHIVGWAAFLALVAGPSMEWARHAPESGDAAATKQIPANRDAGVGAGARLASMRAAPEIEPLGLTGKEYLVVASELPSHPQVRLYWLYPTAMRQERVTGPG